MNMKTAPGARLIDGKLAATRLRAGIGQEVKDLKARRGEVPGLAVVLVGSDPASEVYVRAKARATIEAGMQSFEFRLDAATSQAELLALIADTRGREDKGDKFTPEEADALGAEAQDIAERIVAQVLQAAAKHGVNIKS